MKLTNELIVKPGKAAKLKRREPDATPGFRDKAEAEQTLEKNIKRLANLQFRLYAEQKHALLVVLQGIDAGGKDGTVRHVMSGLNPQSCKVTSFKVPSAEERAHHFLWRIEKAVPARGEIGIFNRSHYEDVLAVRVHKLVPKPVWSERYEQINAFEKLLTDNNVTIVKFFLHISKDEQKQRLEARLQDPDKNWKFTPSDLAERKRWNDYMEAFEDALTKCSTPWAPWYVIPANKKWFRNLAVSQILVETLEEINPRFPKPAFDPAKLRVQ